MTHLKLSCFVCFYFPPKGSGPPPLPPRRPPSRRRGQQQCGGSRSAAVERPVQDHQPVRVQAVRRGSFWVGVRLTWRLSQRPTSPTHTSTHHRAPATFGHADLEPASKRTRPAAHNAAAYGRPLHPAAGADGGPPHYYVPPPTSSSATTPITRPHAAPPQPAVFPSLTRLPVALPAAAAAADVSPPPPVAAKGRDDGWQHMALWLERRARAEQQQQEEAGAAGTAAAAIAADDAMDVADGGPSTGAVVRSGEAWVPLPPRQQRGGWRRPRGLSVEMGGGGGGP